MTQQPLKALNDSLPHSCRRQQSHFTSSDAVYQDYMSGPPQQHLAQHNQHPQHRQHNHLQVEFGRGSSPQDSSGPGDNMQPPYGPLRPQLNMDGLPINQGISFDYQPQTNGQPGHQTSQPGFFFDSGSPSPGLNQASGSFPPFSSGPGVDQASTMYLNLSGPEWTNRPPPQAVGASSTSRGRGNAGSTGAKNPRHQFTACGACRHRRVKCDLRTRQEEAEREAALEEAQSGTSGTVRRRKVSCTNCQERGTNCV